jgi:hypothetical protein
LSAAETEKTSHRIHNIAAGAVWVESLVALPDGLQIFMPTLAAGVDEQVLQQEAVRPTDANLDELTSMLSSLNK